MNFCDAIKLAREIRITRPEWHGCYLEVRPNGLYAVINHDGHMEYYIPTVQDVASEDWYELGNGESKGWYKENQEKPDTFTPEWEKQVHDTRTLQDVTYHVIFNSLSPCGESPKTDPDAIAHACSLAIEAAFERLARIGPGHLHRVVQGNNKK